MKLMASFTIAVLLLLAVTVGPSSAQDDKFVYADFEKTENGRPVSNEGGLIQLYTAQESTPVKFKGVAGANPGAPELVVPKNDAKNHLASFEYALTGPNQWAQVTLEIQGRPAKDGTGTDSIRVEFISHGQGINIDSGFPQLPIRLKPGLNTYEIPLKGLSQPSWVQERIDSKEVMKKLTAISISVYCNQCTPQQGMVAVDNLVFEK